MILWTMVLLDFLMTLTAQFEAENDTFNITYDRRAGNDSVLVMPMKNLACSTEIRISAVSH